MAWLKKLNPEERPETWKLVVFYSIITVLIVGMLIFASGRGA